MASCTDDEAGAEALRCDAYVVLVLRLLSKFNYIILGYLDPINFIFEAFPGLYQIFLGYSSPVNIIFDRNKIKFSGDTIDALAKTKTLSMTCVCDQCFRFKD